MGAAVLLRLQFPLQSRFCHAIIRAKGGCTVNRRLLCILLALCLLTLAGCYTTPTATNPSTTPFPTHQTPLQMLSGAMDKTLQATSFSLQYSTAGADGQYAPQLTVTLIRDGKGNYQALVNEACGCSRYVNGTTAKVLDCQTGTVTTATQETAYGLSDILQDLPPLTPAVLERFCNMGLTATPDKTGATHFSVSGLTPDQLCALLGHTDCSGAGTDTTGSFTLTLDRAGYLAGAQYTACPPAARLHKLELSQINQSITVTAPQWAA